MSRKSLIVGALLVMPSMAGAALLQLENPADGSSELTLAPGESGEVAIMLGLGTSEYSPALLIAFLDAIGSEDKLLVTGVTPGDPPWNCGSGLEPPFSLEEFGLACGGDAIPQGESFTVITLTVTNITDSVGEASVSFEGGAGQVMLFGPPPTYIQFPLAPCGFPLGIPGLLYLGEDGCNDPFIIHLVEAAACEGDANGDNVIDPLDAGYVLSRFGCSVGTGDEACDAADVNADGVVDPLDSGFVLSRFGECG